MTLVEQPLPAGRDDALASIKRPIAVCADESVHDRASLAGLVGKYDAVNIKLDKTGGLTEALAMAAEAERLRLRSDGRLHGRNLARDGAGRAARAAERASSISTARCCSRATARRACATTAAVSTRRRPTCGDESQLSGGGERPQAEARNIWCRHDPIDVHAAFTRLVPTGNIAERVAALDWDDHGGRSRCARLRHLRRADAGGMRSRSPTSTDRTSAFAAG